MSECLLQTQYTQQSNAHLKRKNPTSVLLIYPIPIAPGSLILQPRQPWLGTQLFAEAHLTGGSVANQADVACF